jgi:hypothetical protein
MRHSSPVLFVPFESRVRETTELVTGRRYGTDVATQFAEARERLVSARSIRQDDRPAGRMTLLPAE